MLSKAKQDNIEDFLYKLSAATKINVLYKKEHPQMKDSIDNLMKSIERFLSTYGDLRLLIIASEFILENTPVLRDNINISFLTKKFQALEIEKIIITEGITINEMHALVHLISSSPDLVKESGGINKFLADFGELDNLKLYRLIADIYSISDDASKGSDVEVNIGFEGLGNVEELQKDLFDELQIKAQYLVNYYKNSNNIDNNEMMNFIDLISHKPIASLNQLYGNKKIECSENIDASTSHFLRVSLIVTNISRLLKIPIKMIKIVVKSAFWHDISLVKNGSEYEKHPVQGAILMRELLNKENIIDVLTSIIIFEHHMSFEKVSFPNKMTEIPLHPLGLIVAFADRFDNYFIKDANTFNTNNFFKDIKSSTTTAEENNLLGFVERQFII